MHECARYHDAMCSLTKIQHVTSEQHVDLGQSRKQRDFTDLQKILTWFQYQSHDPFDPSRPQLQALDSGLVANDSVNCDDVEAVGNRLQEKLDGMSVNKASIKRKVQALTLTTLKTSVKVGDEEVFIDPMVLFSRLLILFQRYNEVDKFFANELSPSPMSLFNNQQMMRKPSKSALRKHLVERFMKYITSATLVSVDVDVHDEHDEAPSDSDDELFGFDGNIFDDLDLADPDEQSNSSSVAAVNNTRYVIDGGYLLHRIVWSKTETYAGIIQQYKNYVRSHYGIQCTVVFVGYVGGPSTKNHEHKRRLLKAEVAPDVSIH